MARQRQSSKPPARRRQPPGVAERVGNRNMERILRARQSARSVTYLQPGYDVTKEQLGAWGYRYRGEEFTGNAGYVVEVWEHPSGAIIRRDISPQRADAPAKTDEPPRPGAVPLTSDQERALRMLQRLQDATDELAELCTGEPFLLSDAEDAASHSNVARFFLHTLRYKRVDMSSNDPQFWEHVEHEEEDNDLVRAPCCEQDRGNSYFLCPNPPDASLPDAISGAGE
jgi:hypothetical protein